MKELSWHKNNMDIIAEETANNREMSYFHAIAVAMIYILKWIYKQEKQRIMPS